MATPIIKYPLDLTGTRPDNLVLDEPHLINSVADRAFVPNHGPFYTHGLVVRLASTGQILTPKVDYKATQLFLDATLRTGKEVCSVIVTEPHITGEVRIDYQVVGGDYSSAVYSIEQMIASLELDNRPVTWGGLLGKPEYYPPAPHLHDIGDVYGFEYLVVALEGIRKAILLGDSAAFDEVYQYVDAHDQVIWTKVNQIDGSLLSHLADFANPHRVTKAQIGLANVQNYPVAAATDLLGAGSSSAYITPAQVRLMIDGHATLRNNPHEVTKAQVGLSNVENYAVATWTDVLARANDKYLTPEQMTAYVDYVVENLPEPATPPTPRFTYSGNTTIPNNETHELTFVDVSTPGSTPIVSWLWNFGDGTTSTDQFPTPKTYTFSVGTGGGTQTYTVTLTVVDEGGISKSYSQDITLVKLGVVLTPPSANFIYTGTSVATDPAQPQLAFADTSTPGTGTINSWTWDFGDGSASNAQNPNKIYTLAVGETKTYTVTLTVRDTNGLSATRITPVTVQRVASVVDPTAAITVWWNSTEVVVEPNKHYIDFRDNSTPGSATINAWLWEITAPDLSGVPVTRTYTTRNTGTIEFDVPVGTSNCQARLTVTDANGRSNTVTQIVPLTKQPRPAVGPTANFSIAGTLTTTSPTNPSISVTDTTVAGDAAIMSWVWEFEGPGNGSVYGRTPPTYTYNVTTEGVDIVKPVKLTVFDANGLSSSVTKSVTIRKNPPAANQPPVAQFSFTKTAQTVYFNGSASSDPDGSIVSYAWNFGDGTTANTVSPQHTYPNVTQSYTVTLTVTDNQGATASKTQTVNITKTNTPPTAGWTIASQSNLTVNFNNTSTDAEGDLLSYEWNFGDGTTSTAKNPSKTYAASGTYAVTLKAIEVVSGLYGLATNNVTVTMPNQPPVANFTAAPSGLTVNFTDTSTDSDGTIVSRSWEFGDGTTSTQTNPSKTYAAAGTYSVKLTVTDNGGASASKTMSVTVTQPNQSPVAYFTGPVSAVENVKCNFTNGSTDPDGDAMSASWNFGDGSPLVTTWNASHYFASGNWTISLTVNDGRGGTSTYTSSISVVYDGGGGSGGGCVVTSAVMYDGRTAAEFARRESLLSTDPYGQQTALQEIFLAETRLEPCVRFVLSNGKTLECSESAPIPTRDHGYLRAPSLLGEYVPYTTRDVIDAWSEGETVAFDWLEVVEVVSIGEQYVRYIYAQDKNFWASMDGEGYILHHNLKNEPGAGG